MAREAEAAALGYDARIKNSEGAGFDSGVYELIFMNSQGFSGAYGGTTFSLSTVVIARMTTAGCSAITGIPPIAISANWKHLRRSGATRPSARCAGSVRARSRPSPRRWSSIPIWPRA